MAIMFLDVNDIQSYRMFLKIKSLPVFSFKGRLGVFPDEYSKRLGLSSTQSASAKYKPKDWMFDYQRDITSLAIQKRKFSIFADCGLGKTPIFLEFALHAQKHIGTKRVLIVSPLMVIGQTMREADKFYGSYPIRQVRAAELQSWLVGTGQEIGITNYEAIRQEIGQGNLGALILDESSMLKSHYGKWGTRLIQLGKGLDWKLCCTGTPAPNDRIEYANHAVFMDAFPTVNSFLARFFVNRGQTQERWELKRHALAPFYRALSHWSIFVTNPATYGWRDNCESIPPIRVHIHDVSLTNEQNDAVTKETGNLFAMNAGGITSRIRLGQIAKGNHRGVSVKTKKPNFIHDLVSTWISSESTIIWCLYNKEQDQLARIFNGSAASIDGGTPEEIRIKHIDDFKMGRVRVLISKPKILGFGLNLQIATRQVFSGLMDSYESYYQAVKRSNRIGSKSPLQVHIPVTEIERPMVDNVLRKAHFVQRDSEEQEQIFQQHGWRM